MSDLKIHHHHSLQASNTLAVPSYAQHYCEIHNENQWPALLTLLRANSDAPVFIMGGGSNVVLPENISGWTIKIATQGREIMSETQSNIVIRFAAGENWHETVMWCVDNHYCGIENLALIPGSVGAAPIQNIGAYGVELMDVCQLVEGFDLISGEKRTFSKEACEFSYRESVFKQALKDRFIITHVTLELTKLNTGSTYVFKTDYPALNKALASMDAESMTPANIAKAVIAIRQSKLPNPSDIPNAGSFFKNPIIDEKNYLRLKQDFPNLIAYPIDNNRFKLAAGWLLEKAGWKGKMVNGITMHRHQALVLTNPNQLSGHNIVDFARLVQSDIQDKFGVLLHIEPRVYMEH